MAAPLVVGGITRLHRISSVTAPTSEVTVARTKSGPIVNSGFGRAARKTWPSAIPGPAVASSSAMIQAARLIRRASSGRSRLGQASLVDLGLNVADAVAVELDLDLVVLDVPAVDGRQPPEPASPVRHDPPPAIEQGAAAGLVETLALLGIGPAEAEDLVVGRLARRDARECFARHDGAGLAQGGGVAPRSEVNAPLDPRGEALGEGREQRPGQVAQDEEERGEEHRRPGLPAREVPELHRQHLRPDALGRIEVGRDDLRRPARLARPALAPESVLQPGGLLRPAEPRQAHPELDEPRAIDEPGRPRDPDPAGRRALPARTRLPGVG